MERRSRRRNGLNHRVPAIVTRMDAFREVEDIEVRNISEKGACLSFSINPHALYMLESLKFDLDLGPAGLIALDALPRYVLRAADGRYELGLELSGLADGARDALARYLDHKNRDDARKRF